MYGKLVGKIQAMSKEEIDKVIENSRISQKNWSGIPINERAAVLHKSGELLDENVHILSEILQVEIAKNKSSSISASKIAPALAAGNSVILKPPSQGSISALYLAEIFNKAGLPKGVLNTVTGMGTQGIRYSIESMSRRKIIVLNI